eukprot:2269390-Rhodomonas_salina.1
MHQRKTKPTHVQTNGKQERGTGFLRPIVDSGTSMAGMASWSKQKRTSSRSLSLCFPTAKSNAGRRFSGTACTEREGMCL